MRSILLMTACAATLVALAACSHSPWGAAKTMQTTAASAAAKPAAAPPMTPLPAPTPDERLALALDHLGAKHGPRGEMLILPDREFTHGHAKLESVAADELKRLATVLRDYPKADLIVEGYTDNHGNERRNERLSLERADVVKQALITAGLDGSRIRARGLGAADPIGDNATEAGREENRRVELLFSDSEGRFAATKGQSKTG